MVVGACEPLSVLVPLQPLRELAAGAGDLAELEGGDRLALARSLLSVLRSGGVIVALIEDAHWADPGTLDVRAKRRLTPGTWVRAAALGGAVARGAAHRVSSCR